MINLFQPSAGDDEVAAIAAVFSSNWLGPGERVREFERAFAAYLGRPATEVQAVSSCTEGLFQVMAALGIGPGDEVVLPTISFVGAAHAVANTGARVVLCDVDPVTLNPTVDHVERALTGATRAVVVLHYGGIPGAIADIAELATTRSLLLVEDAACGLGSFDGATACGTFGDAGVWSFDSMKTVTTGDGGMVWCRSEETAARVHRGVRLGVGTSGFSRRVGSTRWWEIDPVAVGRRGTMNDVAAAMGVVQLAQLPEFLARRSAIAARYGTGLAGVPWVEPVHRHPPGAARTFYWIQPGGDVRSALANHLLDCGVYTSFRYWPLHRTQMYSSDGSFPGGDRAAESTLMLPLHQGLSDADVDRVLEAVVHFVP